MLAALSLCACTPSQRVDGGGDAETSAEAGVDADAGLSADAEPGDAPGRDAAPDAAEGADGASDAATDVSGRWTVLMYMAADNNLEPSALRDLDELMGVSEAEHLTILVQIDRAAGYSAAAIGGLDDFTTTKRVRVRRGALEELADLGETHTADPEPLADFVAWGLAEAPAEHVALILWDHGNGWRGFGADDSDHERPRLTVAELAAAIGEGLVRAERDRLTLIGFDACLMATWDAVAHVAPLADFLLASEELEPDNGWDYGTLDALAADAAIATTALAEQVMEGFYDQSRSARKHDAVTLALFDLAKVPAVALALDDLAQHLEEDLASHATHVGRSIEAVERFGAYPEPDRDYFLIDLPDFVEHLGLRRELSEHAQPLLDATSALVLAQVRGRKLPHASGLSIYLPASAAYYDPAYTGAASSASWRSFLSSYHRERERERVAPRFQGGHAAQLASLPSTPKPDSCGNDVCELSALEDPRRCQEDCTGDHVRYAALDCEALRASATGERTGCNAGAAILCDREGDAWDVHVDDCAGELRTCSAIRAEDAASSFACVPSSGGALSSCSEGSIAVNATLTTGSEAEVVRAIARVGYYSPRDQGFHIFGEELAAVANGQVHARWDESVLVVEQAGLTYALYAQSRLAQDGAVDHEVPLLYVAPSACPCLVPGEPGFADSDSDGEPDCIDSDMDADGVADKGAHANDNCPFVHNGSQTDSDADGIGDLCERGSGAPLLTCDAGDVRSASATAMLHVATDGSEGRAVLYANGPAGYSEFVPDPAGRLLPIHPVRVHDAWRWHTESPLEIDLTAPIAFRHALLADVPLRDQNGAIVTNGAGRPLTLRDEEELTDVYIELSIENVAGRGDTTHFIGKSPCAPP